MITEDIINQIWQKAKTVDGVSPDILRLDPCGALIIRAKFGDESSSFGWCIDHIYPTILGGNDDIDNLRAMQCKNCKSKGNDYPVYFGSVTADATRTFNEPKTSQYKINDQIVALLKIKFQK